MCALVCLPPNAAFGQQPAPSTPAPSSAPSSPEGGARAALATYEASPESAGIDPTPPSELAGTAWVLLLAGGLLSLIPGSVGADLSAGPAVRQGPRLLVSWPVQIPLRFTRPNANDPRTLRRTAVYSNHRIVLAPELAIGPQLGPRGADPMTPAAEPWVTFRARAHYRFVHHPRGGFFGWFAGAGTTVEFWPVVRPSLGAEAGLHLASCCVDATAVLQIALRIDGFFAGDDPLRVGALVGWSFY